MNRYAFWNNKGGTGKTSLAFQVICDYARKNSGQLVLVIDVCPQANLSELLLGGLEGGGSRNLLSRQGETPRATVGGYFQSRLPAPYSVNTIDTQGFLTNPREYNHNIPQNIVLLSGDPILELQSNAIATLANNQIPGTDTWFSIIRWLNDFIDFMQVKPDIVFIDLNPSFSTYTQIALTASQFVLLPVMADDSSRRALQNAFSLIHGLHLPSPIYAEHAYATRLSNAGHSPPIVHTIIKNRLTQYMGPASAYATVLQTIDRDIGGLLSSNPEIFEFNQSDNAFVNIRDFQTTGVVAQARGTPFYAMRSGYLQIGSQRVRVNEDQRQMCEDAIKLVTERII